MKIKDLGEFRLIEKIKEILNSEHIGDDCAHLKFKDTYLLFTTDVLVEGVHFLKEYPPEAMGWKAVSVNVSDLAGNGANPEWLLISLIIPENTEVSYIERFYEGVKKACEFYKCEVVGGNVSKGDKLAFDVFAVGVSEKPKGRKGAKPGDSLFVSGTLGDSRAGLEILLSGRKNLERYELNLIERHIKPTARIDYIKHIQKYANASMDISDGLVADALHISRMSKVRIDIDSSKLPISDDLKRYCEKVGKDPVEYALFGGEDYQLLFTHPKTRWNPFLDMTEIGYISEGEGVYVDGKRAEGGYAHF